MKVVIQRVKKASIFIDNKIISSINVGFLILLGITEEDMQEDIKWLSQKIANLRVFNDQKGIMNNSIKDINGNIIVVSQFTLYASTKKGNRPSYIKAAKPEIALPLYKNFVFELEKICNKPIQTGKFGANMQVSLVNDGPVTIVIDTKNKT